VDDKSPMNSRKDDERKKFVAFAFAAAETFLEIDTEGKVLFQSGIPFSARLFGADKIDITGKQLRDFIHPDEQPLLDVSLNKLARHGRLGPISVRLGGYNGLWGRMRLYALQLPERLDVYYLALRVAGLSIALPESSRSRDHDTGLIDEETFKSVAAQAVRSSKDAQVTLAHFDGLAEHAKTASAVEHKKLLKNISTQMQALSVEGQVATQVGEESFAILSDSTTREEDVAEALTTISSQADLRASVSKVSGDAVELSEEEVVKAIGYTIEQLKVNGKQSGDITFGAAYEQAFEETQAMIHDLKYAIERRTFRLAFQPIVGLKNKDLHHYEVLARPPENFRRDDIFGIVQFIESVGLSEQFDLTMVAAAMEFLRKSQKMGDYVSLAINISGASIQSAHFMSDLIKLLKSQSRVEKWLALEITESSKIMDLDAAAKAIDQLRNMGFIVCLDDFGAGASGYQYLRQFKVDFVKIDGIYIRELLDGDQSAAFVQSMIDLTKRLEIKTIAEFVETEQQYQMLSRMGIDCGQGYLFGKGELKPSYGKLEVKRNAS